MADNRTNKPNETLPNLEDWLRQQDEADKAASTTGSASGDVKASRKRSREEPNAVVTGRPTNRRPDIMGGSTTPPPPIEVDLEGKNWIGKLVEYRQAHPGLGGPTYSITSPSVNAFRCTITIDESALPLGDPDAVFSKKKDSRQYAAQLAIYWLVDNSYMPSVDEISFPKHVPRPTITPFNATTASRPSSSNVNQPWANNNKSVSTARAALANELGLSAGAHVKLLCDKLGICTPAYVIEPEPQCTTLYTGYARFQGAGALYLGPNEKVGAFHHVFGKKNAKEECAAGVLEWLKKLEMQKERMVDFGAGGG